MWLRTCVTAALLSKISLINSSKTKPNKPNQNTQTCTTSCPLRSESDTHALPHQCEIMYFCNLSRPPRPPTVWPTRTCTFLTPFRPWKRDAAASYCIYNLILCVCYRLWRNGPSSLCQGCQVGQQQFSSHRLMNVPFLSATLSFPANKKQKTKSKTKTKTIALSLAVVRRSLSPTRLFFFLLQLEERSRQQAARRLIVK